MTHISASDVKALRVKTGAGMMACKKALVEANGDMELAVKTLREKGLAAAAKKSDREANEGRVFTSILDGVATIVEATCETDFVANNQDFSVFANAVCAEVASSDITSVDDLKTVNGVDFSSFKSEYVLKLGENVGIRSVGRLAFDGSVFDYVHMNGKIGVLVQFSGKIEASLGRDIAMHIAAANPAYLRREDVPQDVQKC